MIKLLSGDAVRRVIRTFVIAFLGIEIPGFLGFLNAVTGWANSNGQKPFPDAHNLSFLLVGGLSAAMIAVLNGIVLGVEDTTGKGFLRTVPAAKHRNQAGAIAVGLLEVCAVIITVVALLWLFGVHPIR